MEGAYSSTIEAWGIHLLKFSDAYFPLLFSGSDVKPLVSEACQLAKHRRASFNTLSSFTSIPFYPIQSDVW